MPTLAEAHARLTAPGMPFETVEAVIRGVQMRVWRHVPTTAAEAFAAARVHGAAEFLVYEQERISFDGFARAALAVAALLTRQGIRKGDRVALAIRNLPEWPVVFMGTLLTGAIAVPLNAWWTARELTHALNDCAARFVFADEERLARLKDPPLSVEKMFVTRAASAPDGVTRLEDVIGLAANWGELPDRTLPDVTLLPEDDATIFYTSGTSGAARGALGTHRSLTTNIFAAPFLAARNILRENVPEDVSATRRITLVVVPFFHVIGALSILLPNMAAGGKLVLMRKFEPEAALALIARESVTVTGGVPSIVLSLLDHARNAALSSLALVTYGGAPAPPALAGRIREELGAMPGQGWGMTETSATCTSHSGADYLARPESCGPALPVSRIKVMQGDHEAPPGAVGELWAFGPNIVKGYWNQPNATVEHFHDGWLKTGDLASLDAEGFCTIIDRADDMLIRGGENIYCIEIESVLTRHPAIADAAVIALPHPHLGQVPAAIVQLRPGAHISAAALQQFAREHLAAFKVPARILISPLALPRNAGGKLLKGELRQAFASQAVSS